MMANMFPAPPADAEMVKREFSDFDVSTLPAIPEGFTCTAWHNDAMPTWTEDDTANELKPGNLMLAVDYADISMRESPCYQRFGVAIYDQTDNWTDLHASDDWAEIETMVAFARYVRFLGLGFHVDTRGRDYVTVGSGERVYSDAEADRYDATMEAAHALCDPYETALKVWRLMGLDA